MDQGDIKAVEMVRRIRDDYYELLKNMSQEEQIAFYREKARSVHARADEDEQAHETEEFGRHADEG